MELAKASKTLEEIAETMGRSPDQIRRVAMRLGLSIKPSSNG
jgi:predicted transcriptional regulator